MSLIIGNNNQDCFVYRDSTKFDSRKSSLNEDGSKKPLRLATFDCQTLTLSWESRTQAQKASVRLRAEIESHATLFLAGDIIRFTDDLTCGIEKMYHRQLDLVLNYLKHWEELDVVFKEYEKVGRAKNSVNSFQALLESKGWVTLVDEYKNDWRIHPSFKPCRYRPRCSVGKRDWLWHEDILSTRSGYVLNNLDVDYPVSDNPSVFKGYRLNCVGDLEPVSPLTGRIYDPKTLSFVA
jgi:uncharacterized protein YkvS